MDVKVDTSQIRIETDRLVLRGFRTDDLDDFYEYCRVPGVGEMAGWPHHESIDVSEKILQSFINENEVFALELKENDKVVGSLGLHKSWANDDPTLAALKSKEIGYVLSRDYWGCGLMPEAVRAVLSLCFNELGCDIVTCAHFTTNDRSKRVIEQCGFRFEKQGTFHSSWMNQSFIDMKYVLYQDEWESLSED